MLKSDAPEVQQDGDTRARYCSQASLSLIQSLLATLADIELEFEQRREKVRGTPDIRLKARVLTRLKAEYEARREPYVRELLAFRAKPSLVGRGIA
jgi:hypothetical protein